MATILLVEDSVLVQKVVATVLSHRSHEVVISGTAVAGLKQLRARAFDLILMDLNLPDGRGEQAVRGVRLLGARIPIVVLSGEIKVDTVLELQPYGVVGFVDKANDFEARLVEEVDKALSVPGQG